MNFFKFLLCFVVIIAMIGECSKKRSNPENRTYEESFKSNSKTVEKEEDNLYLHNSLKTGVTPYSQSSELGRDSYITVRTSSNSKCDVIVIVKKYGVIYRNVYIKAGDTYTIYVPNGQYQVFFYSGRGWNPDKLMPNGEKGGFVANESYSKDNATNLHYQGLTYELIPQQHGNFYTKQSNADELF